MNKSIFQKQMESIAHMPELPPHLTQLIVDNKKMTKKIIILESQIAEKNQIIQQLKHQLDSTVVEQTQDKLTIIRTIQTKVQQKVKDIKQKYFEKSLQMKSQIDVLRDTVQQLKLQLGKQEQKKVFLSNKIQSLRQYIMEIVEEKDYLIKELGIIINQQDRKISNCSFCNKQPQQICHQAQITRKERKKPPSIRKNQ